MLLIIQHDAFSMSKYFNYKIKWYLSSNSFPSKRRDVENKEDLIFFNWCNKTQQLTSRSLLNERGVEEAG